MKKLLLGLGALPLVVLPVVAIASCSATDAATLDTEVAKFKSVEAKDKTITAATAAATIKTTDTETLRLEALKLIATPPTLDSGFTFVVDSATADTVTPGSLVVTITITETSTKATKVVTWTITGFSTVDEVAQAFTPKATKAAEGTTTAQAIKTITDATTPETKFAALKLLVDLPTAFNEAKYSMDIKTAVVNSTTNTSIDVAFTLSETGNTTTKDVTWTITGFTA